MRAILSLSLIAGLAWCGAAEAQGVRAACHFKDLCPGVAPGHGRMMDCLKTHKDQLSQECVMAIGRAALNRPLRNQPDAAAPAPAPGGQDEEMDDAPPKDTPGAAAPPAKDQPPK